MCSLPCIWLVLLPHWQHCNGAYLMLDWNNACTESLRAVCEGFVDVSISSSLSKTHWEEGERGREICLIERNSSHGTPTEFPLRLRPNQWSLCAHLSEFLSPLDTTLSVPCNPGPTITSLSCFGTLWDPMTTSAKFQQGSLPTSVYSMANLMGRYGDVVVYSYCESYCNWCQTHSKGRNDTDQFNHQL